MSSGSHTNYRDRRKRQELDCLQVATQVTEQKGETEIRLPSGGYTNDGDRGERQILEYLQVATQMTVKEGKDKH